MDRAYYSDTIAKFLAGRPAEILGTLTNNTGFEVRTTQRDAWREQIQILQTILGAYRGNGSVYFEYVVPRLGKRIDVLAIIGPVIFILEFKIGEKEYPVYAMDQVMDYALDLKNFHETSHGCAIAPLLIATEAEAVEDIPHYTPQGDRVLWPMRANRENLGAVIGQVMTFVQGAPVEARTWESGRYYPTPTIIEAATALYNNHSVTEIARSDATAINLDKTSGAIAEIIHTARRKSQKALCFVTGVPGAGKTLVGLNIATTHRSGDNNLHCVYLSGNGPLVAILREALARDSVRRAKESGNRVKKGAASRAVKTFVQNVHHFRDDCLVDSKPPLEHVAIFDEAQRAWNREQTANFMRRKKGKADFRMSEPEFLISCLDRHSDWAVIVCLVGGGQEINTGEAGIGEWIDAMNQKFPAWRAYVSPRLEDSEYAAGDALARLHAHPNTTFHEDLHLAVSMRSFRAENVSLLVKQLLDLEAEQAKVTFAQLADRYPISITRDLAKAKRWLRGKARGSERYGIVVSSQAERLKPHAIDVKSPMDPIHWFLEGKEDVRSSYYLEDVATEFDVQGLELDWACVTWDADFRHSGAGWGHWSFRGDRWTRIRQVQRREYLKNAYRVLLTRARQGMVICVPPGDGEDHTRDPGFYDGTFAYLRGVGFPVI